MKLVNEQGQVVYYNLVAKGGVERCIIKAASGQTILGRDRQKRQSRTFKTTHQAEAWLHRNGYNTSNARTFFA